MSAAQLKNDLHRLIVETDELSVLEQVIAYFKKLRYETELDGLTVEQNLELQLAVEETYHEENLVDHEVVMERYEKWLKQ
ncbi:MAG: hypothetical protein U5L45_16750 [Saprospiraceae bacterium]|nr:hypothetical protein [Saprospiraceae bacterium]